MVRPVVVLGGAGARVVAEAFDVREAATADFFNLRVTEETLRGATYAVYRFDGASTSRLTQGSRADLNLLCADNFARAARREGVRHLFYLGDVPEILSTLARYGVPVATPRTRAEGEAATVLALLRAGTVPPRARSRRTSVVRSIQRMRLPAGKDAEWAAREYMRWLPRALGGLFHVDENEEGAPRSYRIAAAGIGPVLELTWVPGRSTPDRQLFFVTGGRLVKKEQRGRLELRQVLDGRTLLTALHDFGPRLPWHLYVATQAQAHALVMAAFRRHLARM